MIDVDTGACERPMVLRSSLDHIKSLDHMNGGLQVLGPLARVNGERTAGSISSAANNLIIQYLTMTNNIRKSPILYQNNFVPTPRPLQHPIFSLSVLSHG